MIIDIFPTQIICFNFNKHTKYFFRDPGKIDNTPAGWKCNVNSTFPRIPDDDALVTPDVRDRLKIDIETACNAELVREGLMPCRYLRSGIMFIMMIRVRNVMIIWMEGVQCF